MCDTLVALPSVTKSGHLLLAKNSDREPDEAQAIIHISHQYHTEKNLTCTYIEIPQVEETYECIVSKPFQMWGAEMGANEQGLVIGNEAVFTKVKFDKQNKGLTGMDLLRLALERCKNAEEAVTCITVLLEQYGQDANGGYKNQNFYYHNSFIIADQHQAWVLETAGRSWAAEKVKDIRSISNKLSIDHADQLSRDATSFALRERWWKEESPFSFQKAYSDWFYTRMGRAASRQTCTTSLGKQHLGQLTANDCIQILQTHNLDEDHFKPSKANTGSVCMHATSLLNPSNTTGSMVAEIRSSLPHTVWLTGTAHPCLSIYIPFYFGTKVLNDFQQPSAQPDDSLWWRAEKLHRWINKDYQNRKPLINEERIALQNKFIETEASLMKSGVTLPVLESFSNDCLTKVSEAIQKWKEFDRQEI
jgi:dipeptidase